MTAMEKNQAVKTNPMDGLNLIALRKYACPESGKKKNEWYLACVECDKNLVCGAGRQVVKLLEEQTKPVESKRLNLDERFQEALKHDDPYGWLVDNGYYASRHTACNNYLKWRKSHPGYPDIGRGGRSNGAKSLISTVRKRIETLFADIPQEQKLIHYLEQGIDSKCTFHGAHSKLKNWDTKYPDLSKKYGLHDVYLEANRITTNHGDKTVGEVLKMLKKDLNSQEDSEEISLEDFLEENVVKKVVEKEPPKPIIKEETKPPKPIVEEETENGITGDALKQLKELQKNNVFQSTPSVSDDQRELQRILGKKRQEIKSRIAREEKNLADLQMEIERLKKQITSLDETALLFGLAPVINCGKEVTA